jgi:hypothetical protein
MIWRRNQIEALEENGNHPAIRAACLIFSAASLPLRQELLFFPCRRPDSLLRALIRDFMTALFSSTKKSFQNSAEERIPALQIARIPCSY